RDRAARHAPGAHQGAGVHVFQARAAHAQEARHFADVGRRAAERGEASMFKKVLIANRGEIAVRIIRTCQEMGIETVALYEASDRGSLHVRLATEAVLLASPASFMEGDLLVRLARDQGAQAIHPGYGFLAEEADFIRACDAAGLVFIGPPASVVSG